MENAKRDENFVPTLLGVSSVDGETPVPIYADPITHRLLVDLPGGSGSVTSVSVVSANGFAGTVANPTSTPAITLSTSINGILRGNGTSLAAVTIGSGLSFDGTTLSASSSSVAGSDTQVQFNDGGAFGADAGFTYNKTTDVVTLLGRVDTPVVRAQSSAGILFESNSGTDVADFGAGGGAGATFYGGVNIDGTTRLATSLNGILRATSGTVSVDADVVEGPASATDNALARFDSTTGKLIQDGTISASDVAAGAVTLSTIGNNDLILQTGNAITGSITIVDGANGNVNVNPNGSGALQVTGVNAAGNDVVRIIGTGSSSIGPSLAIVYDPTSPSDGDTAGFIDFASDNDLGTETIYGRIRVDISDVTSGTEDATVSIASRSAGSLLTVYSHDSATDTTTVGSNSGSTVLRSSGNSDLILRTGNVTTGNITIADGANGNISINPNGTGLVDVNGTLDVSGNIELGNASDTTISRSAAGVIAVEGVVIPSISSTNTLTNKRITKRVGTATSSATPTINTDNVDAYHLTAQAVDITSFTTNLSGTPTDFQQLRISVTGTAARAITWGASFANGPVALPTTTVTTTRLDVLFEWDSVTSKWRCMASGSTV